MYRAWQASSLPLRHILKADIIYLKKCDLGGCRTLWEEAARGPMHFLKKEYLYAKQKSLGNQMHSHFRITGKSEDGSFPTPLSVCLPSPPLCLPLPVYSLSFCDPLCVSPLSVYASPSLYTQYVTGGSRFHFCCARTSRMLSLKLFC